MRGAVACSETDFGPAEPVGRSQTPAGGGSQDNATALPPFNARPYSVYNSSVLYKNERRAYGSNISQTASNGFFHLIFMSYDPQSAQEGLRILESIVI